jgi:hypothetical protein
MNDEYANPGITNEIRESGMSNLKAFEIRHSCHFIRIFVIPGFVILLFPVTQFTLAVWILFTIIAINSLFSRSNDEIFSE